LICGDEPNQCSGQLQDCTTTADCCSGLICGGGLCILL
jgi:hypothetical protein